MSELKVKFQELIQKQEDLRKQFQKTAQDLFKETTKEFFDKNPAINAFLWTQYTPYWNDGDTCEFGVNDVYFTNAKGEQLEEVSPWGEYDGEDENVWVEYSAKSILEDNPSLEGQIEIESLEELQKMICSPSMEDVMEAMFGDHVQVIATRDGFEVDHYDHD